MRMDMSQLLNFVQTFESNPIVDGMLSALSSGDDMVMIDSKVVDRGSVARLTIQEGVLKAIAGGVKAGMAGQGVKVTNDALVQSKIVDEYRGRVFAVYDVMVNAGIVSGAIIAAFILPADGVSAVLPALIALIYVLVALVLLRPQQFNSDFKSGS